MLNCFLKSQCLIFTCINYPRMGNSTNQYLKTVFVSNKSFEKFHKPDMIWIVFRSWLSWYGTTFGCRYRWLDEWIKSSQYRISIHHHNKDQHKSINIALLSVNTQIIMTCLYCWLLTTFKSIIWCFSMLHIYLLLFYSLSVSKKNTK